MKPKAYCVTTWSDAASSWVDIGAFEDRALSVQLAGRLVLAGLEPRVVVADSISDDDVEAALTKLKPPRGAFVVHDVDDPNA